MQGTLLKVAIFFLLAGSAMAATVAVCLDQNDPGAYGQQAIDAIFNCGPTENYNDCDGEEFGFVFADSTGLTTVSSIEYEWNVGIDCSIAGINNFYDLVLNSAYETTITLVNDNGNCFCANVVETFTGFLSNAASYVLGGTNDFGTANVIGSDNNCQGLTDIGTPSGCDAQLLVNGEFAGAGSDPYIYSPHIHTQGIELVAALSHETLAPRSALIESATSLLLVDAADVTLTALLGDGSVLVDQGVYLTELTLEVEGVFLVVYTQLTDDGSDGTLAMAYDGHQRTCSRDRQAIFSHVLGGKVKVTVECGPQQGAYEANRLMMSAWPYQSHETQGRVVVESGSFKAEAFYMQQQYSLKQRKWATMEPFGFFNIHTTPANGGRYEGVLGTDVRSSARQAMLASESPEAATAHFLASYLR